MTKTKDQNTGDPVASTLSTLAADIQSAALSKEDRKLVRSRNERVPDQLIEMLAHLAQQSGGEVLGMSFDASTANAALAEASTAQTRINLARQLVQRMEDDMIQQRATVADPAFAIYTALSRLVRTKAGNSLAPAYAQMKAIVKNRPRKTRAKKTTVETGSSDTPSAGTPAPQPSVQAASTASTPSTQAAAPKAVATSTSN